MLEFPAELSNQDLGFRQFDFDSFASLLIEFCWSSFACLLCSRVMATPIFEQGLTLEDVLELSADELRDELAGRDIDPKGMSKVEMQKAFIKILFPDVPVTPVVAQTVPPLTALSAQQLMELEVMKLKMESEEREQNRQALEKKEAFEREEKDKRLRFELEEKAIEREEKAEALRKKEIQEA